jgi:hypothetical protein
MTTVELGKWYLTVPCINAACKRPIIIVEAPEPGEDLSTALDEPFLLKCPVCETNGVYQKEQVERSQVLPKQE